MGGWEVVWGATCGWFIAYVVVVVASGSDSFSLPVHCSQFPRLLFLLSKGYFQRCLKLWFCFYCKKTWKSKCFFAHFYWSTTIWNLLIGYLKNESYDHFKIYQINLSKCTIFLHKSLDKFVVFEPKHTIYPIDLIYAKLLRFAKNEHFQS